MCCRDIAYDGSGRKIAPSSLVSVITPIDRNPSGAQAAHASGCTGGVAEDAASTAGCVPHNFRQLNTWFEFSP
jgi:hypothetical protein